jgi:arsenate reductase
MAEGFLRSFDPMIEVHSAGTQPAALVHPAAVQVMAEAGVDIGGQRPKSVERYLGEPFHFVITVCDHARETCPVFAGDVRQRVHLGFEDPAAAQGGHDDVLATFRRVRDEIRDQLRVFYESRIAVKVRPVTLADLPAAERLIEECGLPLDGVTDQFGGGFVAAVIAGELAGVAGVEVYGSYGLLRSVAVAPEHRGKGAAAALVRDCIEWSGKNSLAALFLLTTTAAAYFTRAGFETVPREEAPEEIRACREFRAACPASATLMRLRL